ncbi:MAG TPA: DEAD/DEAH box helicase family protein [Candidatus Obscuribacterales bacterium]
MMNGSGKQLADPFRDYELASSIIARCLTAEEIRDLLKREDGPSYRAVGIEEIIAAVEEGTERSVEQDSEQDLARLLVEVLGIDLLANPDVRYLLIVRASETELDLLHNLEGFDLGPARSKHDIEINVHRRRWIPGRRWARHFARTLGFPEVFAGIAGLTSGADFEDVSPHLPLPALEDFQQDVKAQVSSLLNTEGTGNRGIVTLPTGAGKTRTTVEALIDWFTASQQPGFILWIAQSEELCEQAVQAFKEVWVDRGDKGLRDVLRIYRLWGNHNVIPEPSNRGVIVASIDKLRARLDESTSSEARDALLDISSCLGAVVIDEAHRAEAKSYRRVLEALGIPFGTVSESAVPLIGLTATPLRSQHEETLRLAKRFHNRLIRPRSLPEDPLDAIEILRRENILAAVKHVVLPGIGGIELTEKQERYLEDWNDIEPGLLQALGKIKDRNKKLLESLLKIDSSWPTLFFACSIEHAEAMAILLRRHKRTAAAVSGQTRDGNRRHLIELFRSGRLSTLCNFGVLTTGFDAPQVRAVVVGRPVKSRLLYEQMIGRGMRGEKFGGTSECLVIDVEDNLVHRDGKDFVPAFQSYREYWSVIG